MPKLDLDGIEVNFPFEPYECQVNYMKSVLKSISERKNAILESPTGTGKTLCLLCSSISWLLAAKADMQFSNLQNELAEANQPVSFKSNFINKSGVLGPDQGETAGRLPYPKIIYASRTHSQLTQVIKELKMTQYNNIRTCAIGSRDQLCINPQVNEQKSYTTKLNMCKAKVTARTCFFYNNIEAKIPEMKSMLTVDIEDLNMFGSKHKCCPYYTARQLKDSADILFMPYNYLLDKKLRKSNNIELTNAVVIFDEAHNVERVCEDSASAELSVTEIASAMAEIAYILENLKNSSDIDSPFQELEMGLDGPLDPTTAGAGLPVTLDELKELNLLLKSIENEIDDIKVQGQDGVSKPARFVFDLLARCTLTFDKKNYYFDILQRLLQYFGAQTPSPRHHNGASLGKFHDFLQTVFSESFSAPNPSEGFANATNKSNKNMQYYKVYIKQDSNKGRTLYFWCLCPGYSMQELLAEGARCIILTSGTLSPISTFKDDMKIPFDVILENPHIIKETQISVFALSRGPGNIVLSSKYTNRDSEDYIRSLGQLIIDYSKIIPHGVLVFFPSYRALDSTTEIWRKNNQWKQIGDAKSIFIESKGSKECNDTVAKFYERIKDKNYNGAIMFAVCRGKISEGIDFADNNGRAVIVTGLPFPLFTDPRVVLKRQYLDESKCSAGQLWYNQQTYRAINQAIGRVIRHKNDYGAIILCDERFAQASTITQLPAWLKLHVQKITEHTDSMNKLRKFFNIAIENFPIIPKIPSIQGNSTSIKMNNGCCSNNQPTSSKDYMNNLFSSYDCGNQASCGSTLPLTNSSKANFYDALGDCSTSGRACNQIETYSQINSESNDFKMILQKKKNEEASKNPKCKVVIRDTVTVSDANSAKINESKALLEKINNKLSKEEYQQFKVALSNFYSAKKNNEDEKKIKYYKILRTIFNKDLEFFREVEKFIQFTGVVKAQKSQSGEGTSGVKRKFNERD